MFFEKRKEIEEEQRDLDWILSNLHSHNVDTHTREIYLHSATHTSESEELGVDFAMANKFIKNLQFLQQIKEDEPIIIHACSVGGEWNYGIAIYDAIKACRSPTICVSHSHARSMSSIIPQAADVRLIMPNCDFMIHYGTISLSSVSHGAKSNIDWNEYLSDVMLNIYAERCVNGKFFEDVKKEQVKQYLDDKMRFYVDWYLNAEDACKYGFMDAIVEHNDVESLKKLALQHK